MNRLRVLQISALTVVAALFVSCGGLNTMLKDAPQVTYSVKPSPLEMRGDSVEVTITGQYPAKFFNKKAVMDVTPVLKWEGGEQAFSTQKLQGEAVEANATIIAFETGGSFTYTAKIGYQDAMDISQLMIRAKASVKDKSIDFPELKIADGVISTPKLAHMTAQEIEAVHQFKVRESMTNSADLLFAINQAVLKPNEVKKSQIEALKTLLAQIPADKDMELMSVKVSGYASPDGAQNNNQKLADKRKTTAESFMNSELKKVDKTKAKDFVQTEATAEDWDGFKQLMAASNIQDKEQILRVLEINSDLDVREQEIKKMSQVYKEIADQVLPQLRRSKLNVNVDKIGKTDSLLVILSQQDSISDTLNVEEYLKAATLVTENDTKIKILTKASSIHPSEWRVYNNLGCVLYKANRLDEAEVALKKADELSEGNTMCKNNLGAVAFKKGDKAKAIEYFELAAGAGKAVSQNQAMIKIKEGDYQTAVNLLGSDQSFNAALAKLLNGDVDGALSTITAAEDPNDALGYYLKAIIGARKANTDLIFTNLRTAVTKDATLAAKAKKDLEFAKYFEDQTFKSIVQ
ncbi:MAG: tetratricopeptide repeat protein [Bacteroidales bacterium]|nr:tetratricopeptide repeat protein [Bacteroidales bacterium]